MINTLGNCSLGFCGRVVSDETIGSRKFWTAMQYLILHRDREIAHKELIDVMYPEGESDNPGNALKTLIHRIRSALDTLKFLDGRRMILNVRGAYKWNTEMAFTIDFVEFEKLCTSGLDPEADDDNRLSDLLEAIAIYKGHYLPKLKHEEWAAPVSANITACLSTRCTAPWISLKSSMTTKESSRYAGMPLRSILMMSIPIPALSMVWWSLKTTVLP
jgi:DNA-binding SARP family transcriptional activator